MFILCRGDVYNVFVLLFFGIIRFRYLYINVRNLYLVNI